MNEDKTIRLHKPAEDKTIRLHRPTEDKTVRIVNRNQTTAFATKESTAQLFSEIELSNVRYQCKRVISANTGEADIFLIEQNGQELILKLYHPAIHPDNRILHRLKSVSSSGLLVKLIEYGVWINPVDNLQRDYGLMEYLRGGTLAEYKLDKDPAQFRKIVMQAAIAVDFCHQNHIIHRDIKPSNLIFRDKGQSKLVLSDFGTALFCEDVTSYCHSEQTRTPLYAAPELYQNVIDGIAEINHKVDFYSLGIVLLGLWLNEPFEHEDERDFMKKKSMGALPYPTDMPDDLLLLLRGLTVVQPERRWGFDEIKRWFNGEKVAVEIRSSATMDIVFSVQDNAYVHSALELALCLRKYPELGKKYLYSGRLTQWLYEAELPELGGELEAIVETHCPKEQDCGLRAAIYTLVPELPYYLPGKENEEVECTHVTDIIKAFHTGMLAETAESLLIDYGFLAWYANQQEPVIYEELKKIIHSKVKGCIYAVLYALDKSISYDYCLESEAAKENGVFTIRQIAEYLNTQIENSLHGNDIQKRIAAAELEQLKSLPGTRLYHYLNSKGWQTAIDWINYCFELESDENKAKCGSYNELIATYKVIQGLGFPSYYYFPKSGKKVECIEDLSAINRDELLESLKQGALKSWLVVQFQENPEHKYEHPFDYERQVKAYLEKLQQIAPQDEEVTKYLFAKKKAGKLIDEVKWRKTLFLLMRPVLTLFVLLPLMTWITLEAKSHIPFPEEGHLLPYFPWEFFLVAMGLGMIWRLLRTRFDVWQMLALNDLKNVLFFYYLSVAAFHFIPVPYRGYYMIAFAIGFIIHIIRKPLLQVKQPLLNVSQGFEARELEPMFYTFKDVHGQDFTGVEAELNVKKITAFKKAARKFMFVIVPSISMSWFILIVYVQTHPSYSKQISTETELPFKLDVEEGLPKELNYVKELVNHITAKE